MILVVVVSVQAILAVLHRRHTKFFYSKNQIFTPVYHSGHYNDKMHNLQPLRSYGIFNILKYMEEGVILTEVPTLQIYTPWCEKKTSKSASASYPASPMTRRCYTGKTMRAPWFQKQIYDSFCRGNKINAPWGSCAFISVPIWTSC